jgi:hypothetical protein
VKNGKCGRVDGSSPAEADITLPTVY